MRILHLLASPVWSGPAETIAALAMAQRVLGHEVEVAVDRLRTSVTSEELAAPRFAALGLLAELGLELSVKSSPVGMIKDVVRLRAWSGDVVHAHFSHDHFLARFGGKRVVRSVHAPRSLRFSLPDAHAYTVCVQTRHPRVLKRPHLLLPALLSPEFVPAERTAVRHALGLSGTPLIVMASTFQASRRHALAFAAFAALRQQQPHAQLVLLGDGALEAELRAQAGAGVSFAGYQSGAAFVRHLQAADQVWVLGLGNDFSARLAAQARACGAAVIAVDEGQLAAYANALVPVDADALTRAALPLRASSAAVTDVPTIAAAVTGLYS